MAPFRWNIAKREQLGRLIDGVESSVNEHYVDELRQSASRMISQSGGSDLVFVGRSLENFFDYLSGLFDGISHPPELVLFQYSGRFMEVDKLLGPEREALKCQLSSLAIDPSGIVSRPNGVTFCDLVAEGGTYGGLVRLIADFAEGTPHRWADIQRKIGLVGITRRKHTSPNTWRWFQHRDWQDEAPHIACSSVSVDYWFWDVLGNTEVKTTLSHSVEKWLEEPSIRRDVDALIALARSAALFDLGRTRPERQRFASTLGKYGDQRNRSVRDLITSLKA